MNNAFSLNQNLAGKTIFITGGSSGIGKEAAKILAEHGANVAITYNKRESVAKEIQSSYPENISIHQLNLRDPNSIQQAMQDAYERWGNLDVVVNNAAAGSATIADYEADPSKQDAAMFEINALGALVVAQNARKLMSGRVSSSPAKIINISSVGGGVQAFPGFKLSDGMSKAAMAFMSKQLAAEIIDGSIHVVALCPGATDTAMFQRSTLDGLDTNELATFVHSLPGKRLITPVEIGQMIAAYIAFDFLSGPQHGAVVDCSLGLGVRPGMVTEMGITH